MNKLQLVTFTILGGLAALGADPKITVDPLAAKPGDSLTVTVTTDPCTDVFDQDSLSVSGGDLTFDKTKIKITNCSMMIPVAVGASPSSRQSRITITGKADHAKELGSAVFSIVDIPPKGIPPGIDPQVDVMWDVLAERNCSDQVGTRLARRYYCIDVQLGNNSGYPLILAGVGFLRRGYQVEYRESTASYLTVRSVIQREQVVSGRNITLRTLQAAGVVIAGLTGFSGNSGRVGRINLWSSLIGTVAATAWDGLVPDRTVRQASNLDDAALRDGKLIPNNSPVRFMIFVDRDAILPQLLASEKELTADAEAYEEANRPKQAVAARERAKKFDTTTKRSANPLGRTRARIETDLVAVRLALGNLIIVGDTIEYKQRIQVDSSAVNPERMPSPQVRDVEGQLVRDKSSDLTVLGTFLAGATVKVIDCPDSTFDQTADPAGGFITLKNFKVPASCTSTQIRLVIDNGGGSYVKTVAVTLQKPTLDDSGSENATVAADGTVTLKLTGTYLAGATSTVTVPSGNVTSKATSATVTSASAVIAKADVDNLAIPNAGIKLTVKVTTTGGDSNSVVYTVTPN